MSLFSTFFPKPHYVIRPIGADHAYDCAKIHAGSFAFPWSKIDFESLLTDRTVLADGAMNERLLKDEMGGMALSRLLPPDAEILTFAVDPARRGAGLGRALLAAHLGNLERGGARLVFLEVGEDNTAALKVYEKLGFKTIGRRENYYQRPNGERQAALTMRCEL
ncbi:acetyltransferase [Methylosinus sp. C49]|jgi:ribosomal-protein-alanine N-acetyltransferase|uniref:GNAT family N-acetyltransferase n=1 Tax=Methylosinus sp. C49 TaxID=2699395 RepID=UPI0013677AF5|nr:GNAT family N-acetyltransferase [Methylosinus sp. C49]BBU62657.1 acetyltransferase [Methylosinus sp. C49]